MGKAHKASKPRRQKFPGSRRPWTPTVHKRKGSIMPKVKGRKKMPPFLCD